MEICSMTVALGVIVGAGPGLEVFLKGVADRVAYTVVYTVSARKPILPPLSVVCIDAVLYNTW